MTMPSASATPTADICLDSSCAPIAPSNALIPPPRCSASSRNGTAPLASARSCLDTLALYTDGITEAYNDAGEEFGESSLIDRLRRYRDLPWQSALEAITSEVRGVIPNGQHDDITLIVAKCRHRA